eukprot:TRINITY_DN66325_c6_g11_i1.p1 TRINITY_DN66325_c6_g11~~TRINITY_DN66325_c6_g11_i1.p1  ORF type:complete len:973 (-),score=107.93 TRINITY_DN66325_c6_g11_i1:75-2993(-)
MISTAQRTPVIRKVFRPKSAPLEVAQSMIILDSKDKLKIDPPKRPKSSPDYVSPRDHEEQQEKKPPSPRPLMKKKIIHRSVEMPESTQHVFQIVHSADGRSTMVPASPPKKINTMMMLTETQRRRSNIKTPQDAQDDPPPMEEEEVEDVVSDAPSEKSEKNAGDSAEEVFDDDFDTDEEPPVPKVQQVLPDDCWGRLVSLNAQLPCVDLTTNEGKEFSLGRSSKCLVQVDDPHVSGTQFWLIMYNRSVCEVEITDKSSNGTYVNNVKLGKGKAITLNNGDEISFQVSEEHGKGFARYLFQFLPPNAGEILSQQIQQTTGEQTKKKHPKIKYKISEVLGRGGFATVYLGMNRETGQLIAVKQIAVERNEIDKIMGICKEIEVLRSLRHSKIVSYYGYDVGNDHLNILLEYVPGGSIASLLEKFGRFDETVIKIYTLQILIGLKYLHDNHVLHRDIKAANILVTVGGTIKLTDFGASGTIETMKTYRETQDGKLPNAGEDANQPPKPPPDGQSLCGTVLWMAPEVISKSQYSMAADIWALACTIIEMATGKPPWSEKEFTSHVSAMYYIATSGTTPQIPQTLSEDGKDFLRKCLRLDPNSRSSSTELLRHPWIATAGKDSQDPQRPATQYQSMTSHQQQQQPPTGGDAEAPPANGITACSAISAAPSNTGGETVTPIVEGNNNRGPTTSGELNTNSINPTSTSNSNTNNHNHTNGRNTAANTKSRKSSTSSTQPANGRRPSQSTTTTTTTTSSSKKSRDGEGQKNRTSSTGGRKKSNSNGNLNGTMTGQRSRAGSTRSNVAAAPRKTDRKRSIPGRSTPPPTTTTTTTTSTSNFNDTNGSKHLMVNNKPAKLKRNDRYNNTSTSTLGEEAASSAAAAAADDCTSDYSHAYDDDFDEYSGTEDEYKYHPPKPPAALHNSMRLPRKKKRKPKKKANEGTLPDYNETPAVDDVQPSVQQTGVASSIRKKKKKKEFGV